MRWGGCKDWRWRRGGGRRGIIWGRVVGEDGGGGGGGGGRGPRRLDFALEIFRSPGTRARSAATFASRGAGLGCAWLRWGRGVRFGRRRGLGVGLWHGFRLGFRLGFLFARLSLESFDLKFLAIADRLEMHGRAPAVFHTREGSSAPELCNRIGALFGC